MLQITNFSEWVQCHRTGLSQYCRSLVGSVDEADDLMQETWLKVWRLMGTKGRETTINKSYLYSVARSIWIDQHRKKRVAIESLPSSEHISNIPNIEAVEHGDLVDALETILINLSINQRKSLLLMDVFRFNVSEAAQLLHLTEGAVKALLHRARTKLKTLSIESRQENEQGCNPTVRLKSNIHNGNQLDQNLVYAYLEAIRAEDITALLMLINDTKQQDATAVAVQREKSTHIHLAGVLSSVTSQSTLISSLTNLVPNSSASSTNSLTSAAMLMSAA
jgi:RNA polymerase sigma factor (sigma-70 family)